MDWKYIITTSIAIISLALGIFNWYNNKFTMKNEFFATAITNEMIAARHVIRTTENLSVQNKEVTEILNFYEYWGMMVRQHHLSISVFKSASGKNVIELFDKLKPIIDQQRVRSKLYARDFEWLYDEIKKKYKDL